MDCKLSLLCSKSTDPSSSITKPTAGQAVLAVGLSDNAVELYDLSIKQADMVRSDRDTGICTICIVIKIHIEYRLHKQEATHTR